MRTLAFLGFCAMTLAGLWFMWPPLAIVVCGLAGASMTLIIHVNDRSATPAPEPTSEGANDAA